MLCRFRCGPLLAPPQFYSSLPSLLSSSALALCQTLFLLRLLPLEHLHLRSLHSRLSRLSSHLLPNLNRIYRSMTFLMLVRVALCKTLPRAPPPLATAPLADSRSTMRSVAMTMLWLSTTSRLSSPSHLHLLQGPHEARALMMSSA